MIAICQLARQFSLKIHLKTKSKTKQNANPAPYITSFSYFISDAENDERLRWTWHHPPAPT